MNWLKKNWKKIVVGGFIFDLLVLGGGAFGLSRLWQPPANKVEYMDISFDKLELAKSPQEQAKGLMNRQNLCDRCGVIFEFEKEQPLSFWMKNTLIPLDIVFLDKDGKILNIARNAVPQQQNPTYDSTGSAKYVIEVKAGQSEKIGLQEGNNLKISEILSKTSNFEGGF
jgi:uncharacterized membrane protein (UPF0127 family)